jgi:very-short-patch-repair endonuclease
MSKVYHSTKRKTKQDYIELATRREFKWVGEFPQSTNYKTDWQCQQQHKWSAAYNSISQGSGCPYCAGNAPASIEDYAALAQLNGLDFIGPLPANVRAKAKWRCSLGHEWETAYSNILSGCGCPICSHHVPLTEMDYHDLAASKSLAWLGPFPKNTLSKTSWQCLQCGYAWGTTYQQARMYNCPRCSPSGRKARIEPDEYHDVAQSQGFEWVGEFPFSVQQKTLWRCPSGHEWMATYTVIRRGHGCPYCSGNAGRTPDDYHQIANSRSYKWHGPLPPSTHDASEWECVNGHRWWAAYNNIQRGTSCPHCYDAVRSQHSRLPESDYIALASTCGLEWLGPYPNNIASKTTWRCQQGHTFERIYNSMRKIRTCPHCHDYVNGYKVSKQQRKLAEMLSGELNKRVGRYVVDVALEIDGVKIAIEYDSRYWHTGNEDHDAKRDALFISQGWRVLHVKSNTQLPTLEQLNAAIALLLAGDTYAEIILPDWKG